MKKIIKRKSYNTETADCLFKWNNGQPYGDLRYREASLFLTKKGQFFCYDSGGPLTDMAVSVGNNNYSGSSDIRLMDSEEVIDFLEEYNGYDVLLELFPDYVEEG